MSLIIAFKVSVIIPVYNAEAFIKKAVTSAVHLPQVGEIILVEDNSPDNSLALCKKLENEYERVKLYRHPNGENRGAGASRNLGVQRSTKDFIAFLDADDYYLPSRFVVDEQVLSENKNVDGVYNAVGVHYYDEIGKHNFNKIFSEADDSYLTTIRKQGLSKEELLESLINGTYGYFHTNGITIRKKAFIEAGCFDVSLRLHQDTFMWIKLAFYGSLLSGDLKKPVAIRGVHINNRHTSSNKESKSKFAQTLFLWGINDNGLDKRFQRMLFLKYIYAYKGRYNVKYNRVIKVKIFVQNLLILIIRHPIVLRIL